MKKAFFLIILLFADYTIHAQCNRFEIGIEGGPDVANSLIFSKNQSSHNLSSWEYQTAVSFSSGITALYKCSNRFSLKFGLSYQQNFSNFVYSYDANIIGSNVSYTEKMPVTNDYIVLPVLARYSIGNPIRFFVNGGPYLGYLLKGTIQGNFRSANYETTEDVTNSEYRVDFGASAGFGVGMNIIDRLGLEIEARGNYGLINVNKAYTSFNETRNFSGNLLIGLRCNLGK